MVGAAASVYVDPAIQPAPQYRLFASVLVDRLQQPYGSQVRLECGFCGGLIVEFEVVDDGGFGFTPSDHVCPSKEVRDEAVT